MCRAQLVLRQISSSGQGSEQVAAAQTTLQQLDNPSEVTVNGQRVSVRLRPLRL